MAKTNCKECVRFRNALMRELDSSSRLQARYDAMVGILSGIDNDGGKQQALA